MIIIAYKLFVRGPVQRLVCRNRTEAGKLVEAYKLIRYRLWNDGWFYSSLAAEGDQDLQSALIEGPADVRIYL